jgi:DNA polymerase II small subunit
VGEASKLQKAVGTSIAAGYQIDSEAFAYLTSIAATQDPTEIINKALLKIEELEEKPLFIEKDFLQNLREQPQAQTQESCLQPPTEESTLEEKAQPTSEGTSLFQPYAKDIEPQIKIIDDPTKKLTSNGTLEDYLQYFQDRFKRLERLLRQRIDVKAATPILEALKSPAKTKLKIICMISEKREAKQHIILTVEDLQATATVLVTKNAPEELRKKAQTLLTDQVVCIAVMKTRSRLFLAEDIIFPEISQRTQHKATEPVYAVLTSDLHVGSTKFNKEAFKKFTLWLNGKYGNDKTKEIASHVKYVLTAGDIVDGIGIYPNQVKELAVRDVYKQYRFASKLLAQIPEYIELVISPGNHDAPRKALPQPAISDEFLKTLKETRKIHSLGDPSLLSIHGVEVLMYHGRSLDDIFATVPSIDHNHPEKAMKILLQSRHLAPLYGGKTMLSPENRDFLTIEHTPDIFHAGHIHVLGYCNYRGVLVVNSGGWQEQTDYMQKLGLMPTPGKVPVINLQTLETTVLSFA